MKKMKEILKAKYPWLDKENVADITRKTNNDLLYPHLEPAKPEDEPKTYHRKDP